MALLYPQKPPGSHRPITPSILGCSNKPNSGCPLGPLPLHLYLHSHCFFCPECHPTKLLWLSLSKSSVITISSAHQKTYTLWDHELPRHRPKPYFTLACPTSWDQVDDLSPVINDSPNWRLVWMKDEHGGHGIDSWDDGIQEGTHMNSGRAACAFPLGEKTDGSCTSPRSSSSGKFW